jgi:hypothetical protein
MRFKQLLLVIGLVFSGSFLRAQVKIAQGLGLFAGRANVSGFARGHVRQCIDRLQLPPAVAAIWPGVHDTGRTVSMERRFCKHRFANHAGIGFTGNYNSTDFNGSTTKLKEGINGAHLAFELPVVADLNIGMHSAADEKGSFGFYLGAGYAYSYTKLRTSVGKVPFDGFDPLVRVGIRMGRNWETRWGLVFSIRGAKIQHACMGCSC